MRKTIMVASWAALALLGGSVGPARADVPLGDDFRIQADVRFRLEDDFDSRRADGTMRDDRLRARLRARVGFVFEPGGIVSMGLRIRSGSDASHQSPHITILDLDGNDTGDADFNLDRWYVRAKGQRTWAWAGRDGLPFWKQNELFWDDDATVAGLAGGVECFAGERNRLSVQAAYLTPPVGMRDFAGRLATGQVVYGWSAGGKGLTLSGGLLDYHAADPADDADALTLANGNGLRDYRIWVGSAQVVFPAGGRPLAIGADYLLNGERYERSDPDPFTAAHHDRTRGVIGSVRYGEVKEAGDWQAGWYYARIDALAVIASYAQDDWVRWGSDAQTDSSDLKGHELRFVYGLSDRADLTARLYLVEAITSVQDGRRARVDLNYRF